MTEKVLDKYIAPVILSIAGRLCILILYVALLVGAAFACVKVEIDF